MSATTYGPTAPLLTAGRITRLAKEVLPGVRVSTERGADCFLTRVWTGDEELRMLNKVAARLRELGYAATVVSGGSSHSGRAVYFRVKVTDPRVQEAAEEKITRDREAALAAAQQEVAEAEARRAAEAARLTAARTAQEQDAPETVAVAAEWDAITAAAAEQAELQRLEAKALEGPLWDGEARRLRELEDRQAVRRARAEEPAPVIIERVTITAEEALSALEPVAAELSYRSIRSRAYKVLSGGQVIGRVARTVHSSDALLWEAFRPGGGSAGHGQTRQEAARLLLPLSAQAEETLRQRAAEPVRIAVDADCPACGYPERSFDPATGVFGCSSQRPGGRCGYESTERNA